MSRPKKSSTAATAKAEVLKLLRRLKGPEEIQWVRTGIHALDLILGGGFTKGRIIELFGSESSGKSTLGWVLARVFQNMGGYVIFLDMEATEPSENAKKLGVNINEVFRPDPMPETVEQVRDAVKDLVGQIREIDKDSPILVLWDTIAATSSIRMWDDFEKREAKDVTMGAVASALSQYFSEFTRWLKDHNVTMLCINQVREKIGVMFGNPETSPGGRALKYYAAQRVKLNRGKKLTVEDRAVGFTCHAEVIKNKFAPMFRKAELRFSFEAGKAFDPWVGLEDVLEAAGRLTKIKGKPPSIKVGDQEYPNVQQAIEVVPELLNDWINQ